MEFNFELPAELGAKLEEAAQQQGETAENLAVLAIAEKLARMEHETWLSELRAPAAVDEQGGPALVTESPAAPADDKPGEVAASSD